MKIEIEVSESTGFPFLHENIINVTDPRSKIKSVSMSLTGTALYFWPHEGGGFHVVNLVPIIQEVIGALSNDDSNPALDRG